MKHVRRYGLELLLLLPLIYLILLCPVMCAGAPSPLSQYEDGQLEFREYSSGNLLVYYHQRKLGEAIVENDFIVYQFDAATEKLISVRRRWRDDLPDNLTPIQITREEAESLVEGEVLRSSLYIISPESDVFPLEPVPQNPCWVVRHIAEGNMTITLVDAVDGSILGNGVPPPYTGFALSGPWTFIPCSGTWDDWRENARTWFETMGYPTESVAWPEEDKVRSHIQSGQTALFYELAHGNSRTFTSGCLNGLAGETTTATEIEAWIADYAKMPFAFVGSCGGLCLKVDDTFAYEFRKGEPESSVVVGYCNMDAPECDVCWGQSILWQTALFEYISQGWTVKAAHDQAKADYPECGENRCMRFAGDQDFAIVPVVKRDPWPPEVLVIQPNGGEVLEQGMLFDIQWVASDNALIDSVAILLSTDGGLSFPDTIAAGLPNDSSYIWSVPDIDSRTARVRVAAMDGGFNEGADASDADFTLWGALSGVDINNITEVPADWTLSISGGNPVRSPSKVVLGLPEPHYVSLSLYSVTGREILNLMSGHVPPGFHSIPWTGMNRNGTRLSPGIYFLRLDCGNVARSAKVVIAR